MDKISVIIPVYNVEKYLKRCVDSVLNQTYKNVEVILVDDGSPDSCPEMCDEYAKKDARVKTIHKNNGGLASARNAGLDSGPTGKYVTFIDSDDWISLDYYEYCIRLLSKFHADVAQIDYTYVTENKIAKKNPKENISVYSGKDILQHYMITTTKTGSYSVCRCLFPKDLIGEIRFREGRNNEDVDFKYKVLSKCKVFVDSNQVKYFYYQSGNSISTGITRLKHIEDAYVSADELIKLTKNETYGTIRFLGEVKQKRTPFSFLCRIAMFGLSDEIDDKKGLIQKLTEEHRHNLDVLLKAPIPFTRKVLALLFAIDYHCVSIPIYILKKLHVINGVI